MPFLDEHLEQISASSKAIRELEYATNPYPDHLNLTYHRFAAPKIFTNALLGNHEITNLIRDTEPHERALFSLDPNAARGISRNSDGSRLGALSADSLGHGRKSIYPSGSFVKQSAVARVLGNDMLKEIRQSSGGSARGKGGVNVEILLQGAERLCEVYAVGGATDRIAAIRRRYEQITTSIADYQQRVSVQQSRLDQYQSCSGYGVNDVLEDATETVPKYTEQDFEAEEAEVAELEAKKKALEARVAGMEEDLGGLLR
jgi:DASH complex subunit Spc34